MLGRKVGLASILVLSLAGLLGAASGQFAGLQERQGDQVPAPVPDGPGPLAHRVARPRRQVDLPLDYSLKVYFNPRLPEAQKVVYQQLTDRLNKAKISVPDDRIAYFRSVIDPEARQVVGWSGEIRSFEKIKGGIVVNLRVGAVQDGMFDTASLMERYSITNGQIQYLGCYVPDDVIRAQAR